MSGRECDDAERGVERESLIGREEGLRPSSSKKHN